MKKWGIIYAFFYYLICLFFLTLIALFSCDLIIERWVRKIRYLTLGDELILLGFLSINFFIFYRLLKRCLVSPVNLKTSHWNQLFYTLFYHICYWLIYIVYIFLDALSRMGGLWN